MKEPPVVSRLGCIELNTMANKVMIPIRENQDHLIRGMNWRFNGVAVG